MYAQASRFLQQSPASVALHHKLCHTLGGTFDMPHAQTHTAVPPHAIAYNAPSVPEAMERASRALGGGDPATKLYELAVGLGAEMRSEEHTSELQSLMRISYAVFCLKKKKNSIVHKSNTQMTLTNNTSHHYNIITTSS